MKRYTVRVADTFPRPALEVSISGAPAQRTGQRPDNEDPGETRRRLARLADVSGSLSIPRGGSADVLLTPEQAWSLSLRRGVTVDGAPTEDPRPPERRPEIRSKIATELATVSRPTAEEIAAAAAKHAPKPKPKAAAPAPADDSSPGGADAKGDTGKGEKRKGGGS